MSRFVSAMQRGTARTTNGMRTNVSSGSSVMDMFFLQGGWRTTSENEIVSVFASALAENPTLAIRSMFYNRDVRGGQGERRSFRIMFKYLCEVEPQYARQVLAMIPEYGRWDDVLEGFNTEVEYDALMLIRGGLVTGDKLCTKWMPRENKSRRRDAKKIREFLKLSRKNYRLLLSDNTEVVESLMCDREWRNINYSHVPSVAMNKYRNAFLRNDENRFRGWLDAVTSGDAKVNAGALFPHDIVKPLLFGGIPTLAALSDEQWKALPNWVGDQHSLIAVVDVSGSMMLNNGLPISAAIALGIYVSERNTGPFKDAFFTFSSNPRLQVLKGKTITAKVTELRRADWGMSTDLNKVFSTMLDAAVRDNLSNDDMPRTILILSDMQFNRCVRFDDSAMQMIRRKYKSAGYTVPNVVFWNLNSSGGVPVSVNEKGVALVSGFSPSIMKSILGGTMTPKHIMMNVLTSDRYNSIQIR